MKAVAGGTTERKLAAILAADMVGFSRQMGADEAGTLARIAALRADILDPLLVEHHGRLFKTMGDGFLAEFASAVQAVACAVAIQSRLAAQDGETRLRIGIHQGDVAVQGDDLLGDGVNIAARLEPLAEPGGIVISARVREDTRGRLEIAAEDMGPQNLKNISEPVAVFRISPPGATAQTAALALALPDKPSIAVLPFANMSGDAEQEYFADGVAEDIITELARFRALFVIARNSSFTYRGRAVNIQQVGRELGVRYVLEGSVRRAGNRIRVTGQLIEAASGAHLWAERYDRDLTDVFAMQDEITQTVVRAIAPAVAEAEQQRALRRPPENLGAWEAYQRGLWHMGKSTRTDVETARDYFQRAVVLDAAFSPAHGAYAFTVLALSVFYGAVPLASALQPAHEAARQAVAHDAANAEAQATLAWTFGCQNRFDEAIPRARAAQATNPNSAWANSVLGLQLLFGAKAYAEARAWMEMGIRLNPRDPFMAMVECILSLTYYHERDYAMAAEAARRAVAKYPDHPVGYRFLIAALGQLGETEAARAALAHLAEMAPDWFVNVQRRPPWWDPEDHAHQLEGFRKAGWQG